MKDQSFLRNMLLLYLKTEMTCDIYHCLPDACGDVLKLSVLQVSLDRVVVHLGSSSVFMVGN